jgi:hypothetical protein
MQRHVQTHTAGLDLQLCIFGERPHAEPHDKAEVLDISVSSNAELSAFGYPAGPPIGNELPLTEIDLIKRRSRLLAARVAQRQFRARVDSPPVRGVIRLGRVRATVHAMLERRLEKLLLPGGNHTPILAGKGATYRVTVSNVYTPPLVRFARAPSRANQEAIRRSPVCALGS